MSLTELMIAGGIGLALVAGGLYFGMRFTQTASQETTKNELNQAMELAARQFEIDFSNAIKVRGSSKFQPGVFSVKKTGPYLEPLDSLRLNDFFDRVVMFTAHAKEFSVSLDDLVASECPNLAQGDLGLSADNEDDSGPSPTLMRKLAVTALCFDAKVPVKQVNSYEGQGLNNSGLVHQWNAQGFLNKALESTDLFLASNLNFSFFIEKLMYQPPTGVSDSGQLKFKIWFREGVKVAAVDVSALRLQAVKRVSYSVNAEKELIREVRNFLGTDQTQVLLKNTQKFHVDYLFADRRKEIYGAEVDESGAVIPLNLPTEPLSAPVFDEESRLWWSDVSAARLTLKAFSNKAFKTDTSAEMGDGLCELISVENQERLSCERKFFTAGADFEELLVEYQSGSETEECLPGDVQNRCRGECQHVYISDDPNALNWRGYGDLNSDYCLCKGESQINPEEVDFEYPAFNPEVESPRLNACIRHFGGCTSGNLWKNRDPRLGIACGCIQNSVRNEFILAANHRILSPWPPSQDDDRAANWSLLKDTLLAIHNQGETPFNPDLGGVAPHYNPWMPTDSSQQDMANNFRCKAYNHCHARVKNWLGLDSLGDNSDRNHPFNKYCGCLSYEPSTDNGSPTSVEILESQKKWTQLQEVSWCPNLYSSSSSPVTYWQSKIVNGVPTRQALIRKNSSGLIDRHDAAYVECARLPEGFSSDFRNAATDLPPTYPTPVNPLQEASINSKAVQLSFTEDGQNSQVVTDLCASAECFATASNSKRRGCCLVAELSAEDLAIFMAQQVPGNPTPTSFPDKASWQGYCHSRCPENVADVRRTKNYFLNRSPDDQSALPTWCGGSAESAPAGDEASE